MKNLAEIGKLTFVERVAAFYDACGIGKNATLGVAFSGGADSVALLVATVAAGYRCVALHCNFHLRGDESNRDEAVARSVAQRLGCEIRVVDFDVDAYRAESGESVEMACRTLRYDWFRKQWDGAAGGWAAIAVGHHADDNVETFFLNLSRGSGLRGLAGMPIDRAPFVRPLLNVRRIDIMQFLTDVEMDVENSDYVVDSSNLSVDYRRNALRNRLLPEFERFFPKFRDAVSATMGNLSRDLDLLNGLIEEQKARYVDSAGRIDLLALSQVPNGATLLFHLLNSDIIAAPFNFAQVESMLASAQHSGTVFKTAGSAVNYVVDHGWLVRDDVCDADEELTITITDLVAAGGVSLGNFKLTVELLDVEKFVPTRNNFVMWTDAEAIADERLTIRRWRASDRMAPFGMRGTRLLSDIYSDAKLGVAEKHRQWVVATDSMILWAVGQRASRHFAVSAATRKVLKFTAYYGECGNINKI